MPSRADRMLLLARVEVARESLRRSELTTAEDELRAATANAAEAANSFQRARQERSLILSQWYAGSAGRHAATFVQDLRTTERT